MLAFAEQANREYEAELYGQPSPDDRDNRMLTSSTELSKDIDEFFRQYDVEYAAMFPNDIVQKHVIQEYLYKGDTSAIKEGLINEGRERDLAEEVTPLIDRLDAYEKEFCMNHITPDDRETGETVRTPRGTFHMTDMSREQMEAAGYGFHLSLIHI